MHQALENEWKLCEQKFNTDSRFEKWLTKEFWLSIWVSNILLALHHKKWNNNIENTYAKFLIPVRRSLA